MAKRDRRTGEAGEPTCGRMLRDIKMQNLASSVAEDDDDAHVQQTKRGGDDHKHVDGGDAVHLIAQEGPRGRARLPDKVGKRTEQCAIGPNKYCDPQKFSDSQAAQRFTLSTQN
jgi:hypothetical protein